MTLSFSFNNRQLNSTLINRLKQAHIPFTLGMKDTIRFSEKDEEAFESILSTLREEVFPTWQIISCPAESLEQYRQYMEQHDVPYQEEITDGEVGFLIPRHYRPHAWRFGEPGFRRGYGKMQTIPVASHSRKAAH